MGLILTSVVIYICVCVYSASIANFTQKNWIYIHRDFSVNCLFLKKEMHQHLHVTKITQPFTFFVCVCFWFLIKCFLEVTLICDTLKLNCCMSRKAVQSSLFFMSAVFRELPNKSYLRSCRRKIISHIHSAVIGFA